MAALIRGSIVGALILGLLGVVGAANGKLPPEPDIANAGPDIATAAPTAAPYVAPERSAAVAASSPSPRLDPASAAAISSPVGRGVGSRRKPI